MGRTYTVAMPFISLLQNKVHRRPEVSQPRADQCASSLMWLLALLCTCLLTTAASAAAVDVDGDLLMTERFGAWQAARNRTYATAAERRRRFEVYRRNVEYIESTNRRGGLPYELGENQFAELTNEEFHAAYTVRLEPRQVLAAREAMRRLNVTGAGLVGDGRNSSYEDDAAGAVPMFVDWRRMGAVTPPRSQMSCGSCWAFATVASIESLYKLKTGRLVSLSEQELVDCDTPGDHGCNGGWPWVAMGWIARNGGLATASEYPYESKQGGCRRDRVRNRVARIRGGALVERNSEAALERAVARQPVAVVINAAGGGFQFYKAGVFSGPCDCARVNHAVTVVGYGADPGPGGRKYWIVKNSWGEGWGEKGYVRMERCVEAKEGMCGIATLPQYPVM